jgi:protein O-GlcNAc transferase
LAERAQIDAAFLRAQTLLQLGAWEAAEAACQELLHLAPKEGEAWYHLGMALLVRGELTNAEAALEQAVALTPANGRAWNLLSIACYSQAKWEATAAACQQAVLLAPGEAITWSRFGTALLMLRRMPQARAAFEQALRLDPQQLEIATDYGHFLCHGREPEAAIAVLRGVVERDAKQARAWVGLGMAYGLLDRWDDARAACQAALIAAPHDREARSLLAIALLRLWQADEAEQLMRPLIDENPQDAAAWALLGAIFKTQGRAAESSAALRRSLEIEPQPGNASIWLLSLQYLDDATPLELLAAHRRWDAAYARPLSPPSGPAPRAANGLKLRIGFCSLDFGRHPTGYLALPAIEHLDRNACSVICYCDRLGEDEFTVRFRRAADLWRVTSGLAPDELAAQIRADEIDILFDLMGHTGQRLLTFARKPAPLQITWLGYAGTTGVAAIDCLVADRHHVREGEEPCYSEGVLRMPRAYACYDPPADAPDVSPLPALATGRFTFGCFNNPVKFAPRLLTAWAEVLRRVPASQLLLKYGGLNELATQAQLRGFFAERGVAEERIVLEGWSPPRELLAAYHRVDLALDTQPYSGGLTTCEALWMGVPVVTYPGQTFAGRHSTSYLSNCGCEQFVATDRAGYVDLAVEWANRLEELAAIRAGLRERLRSSHVCDARTFADDLLALLRHEWEARVQRA